MEILIYITAFILINVLIIALIPAARNQYLEFIKSIAKENITSDWEDKPSFLKRMSKRILFIFLLVLFHCLIAIIAIPLLPFLIKNERKRLLEVDKKRKSQGFIQETEDGVIIEGFVGQMTPLKLDNSKEYVELFLQVYSGTVTTYKRVIFWNELAQAVINTVNRDCKLRVEGESEIITIINERGDEKQQDRIKAKNMMLLRFAKPLTFGRMGGVGSIQCFDCKYEKEIISFIRGVCESTIGYQCQSCGKTHELKSISDEYREINIIDSLICDCGGELSRDKSLFCPECKSTRMSYKMSYIT